MPKSRFTVSIDSKLLKKFREHCKKEDKNYSKATSTAIDEYMKKRGIK